MNAPKTALAHIFQRNLPYYLDNIRIKDWRAYFGIAFLGFGGRIGVCPLSYFIHDALKFTITIILYLAFTFSINNCFDVSCDIHQDLKLKKNPIAMGLVSFREGLAQSLSLAFIGIALAYSWFGVISFILYSMLVFLGGAYSAPPLRFKSIPLVDLISHGLFFGTLLYLYGVSVARIPSSQTMIFGASIFIYSIMLELRNHLDDFQADFISKTKTTVCWIGYANAIRLLHVLLLIHWAFLVMISFYVGYGYFVAALGILVAAQKLLLRSDRYLRITDLCTCAVYILGSAPNLPQFFLGGV
jgi:4-hydroxybenzoate polyprenyltransferase